MKGVRRVDQAVHELEQEVRDREEDLQKLRLEVVRYLDHPGCNPNSRRLAQRRLRCAAGINQDEDDRRRSG